MTLSDEQNALLIKLWSRRPRGVPMPAGRIAVLLGVGISAQAVTYQARALGLKPRNGDFGRCTSFWSIQETRRLIQLIENGGTVAEVAEIFLKATGKTKQATQSKVKRLGLAFTPVKRTSAKPTKHRKRNFQERAKKLRQKGAKPIPANTRAIDGQPFSKSRALPKDLRIVATSESHHKPLWQLADGECHWPVDELMAVGTGDTLFCGKSVSRPKDRKCRYCDEHSTLVPAQETAARWEPQQYRKYAR